MNARMEGAEPYQRTIRGQVNGRAVASSAGPVRERARPILNACADPPSSSRAVKRRYLTGECVKLMN